MYIRTQRTGGQSGPVWNIVGSHIFEFEGFTVDVNSDKTIFEETAFEDLAVKNESGVISIAVSLCGCLLS